ncbi:Glyceraldehyde-3-phosphate dehydrogenase B [Hibiscus syriacus]|uniref:Glyceraldehyde-3-phosphate dehydrogenase B n=1 Tax=Hibiscus syriacus TaxID=106335 RepID=A0A6A3CR42_HIBSY|nr:Glyceraldehyde-3-phosphate dehydrogenase B [Hibiscus syriacus]
MATHAALSPSRIPAGTRLPSKTTHSFPTQCSSKRLDVAEFSGLRSSAVGASSAPVRGETVAKLKVVVVNDSGGVKNASHLLKYDSMLGTFKADVKIVDNETIVLMGTGVFVDGPGAGKRIQAGAKKVIITAPAKGADIPTYVVGVNEGDYKHEGTMTTTHSYTGDQRLLDASHRDLRRARAAALNIVPTSTGAVKAVSLVLPQLKGKLNRIALRVPTPNVSVVDLVVNVEKKGISAEDVNAAFRKCSDVSSTIDSSLTMVMGDDMVKVVAWYDNEWGYSQRVVDLAHLVAAKWPGAAAAGTGDSLEDYCKTNPADKECKV